MIISRHQFVDAYSRYIHGFIFLQSKFDVFSAFQRFKALVEKCLGRPILSLQTHGGGEFKTFIPFRDQHSIEHHITYSHKLQQNGVVEQNHRHIMNMGLSLLYPKPPYIYPFEMKSSQLVFTSLIVFPLQY